MLCRTVKYAPSNGIGLARHEVEIIHAEVISAASPEQALREPGRHNSSFLRLR